MTKSKPGIRVAMIAPPWLPIPPEGYGGIENVIFGLATELSKLGVEVEVFTTGDSKLQTGKIHWLYPSGQYKYIHKPQYESLPISVAHLLFALNTIEADGKFDIIHDHNGFLGPLVLSKSNDKLPPAIHTLHGPPLLRNDQQITGQPETFRMWQQLAEAKKPKIVAISKSLASNAPRELKAIMLPYVHNAIDCQLYPFVSKKDDYFITLGRFHPEKGQALAVKACLRLGYHLKMAGMVSDISSPKKVLLELANPLSPYRSSEDFRYYSDFIFPHLLNGNIENVGEVGGAKKLKFIGQAKALLFPIQWEEPFGMAVIEALACGTPVVAMNRGAMPEIIDHGVNGFLANNEVEFIKYIQRIDDIDPLACRQSVERKFSAKKMAQQYLERYLSVIKN